MGTLAKRQQQLSIDPHHCLTTSQNATAPKPILKGTNGAESLTTSQNATAPKLQAGLIDELEV